MMMNRKELPLIDVVRAILWLCLLGGFLFLKHIFPKGHVLVQYSTGFYGVFLFFLLAGVFLVVEINIAKRRSKKKQSGKSKEQFGERPQ